MYDTDYRHDCAICGKKEDHDFKDPEGDCSRVIIDRDPFADDTLFQDEIYLCRTCYNTKIKPLFKVN